LILTPTHHLSPIRIGEDQKREKKERGHKPAENDRERGAARAEKALVVEGVHDTHEPVERDCD